MRLRDFQREIIEGAFAPGIRNGLVSVARANGKTRLAANSRQLAVRDKVDDVEREFRNAFNGWSLAEQIVLNRYRVRAM